MVNFEEKWVLVQLLKCSLRFQKSSLKFQNLFELFQSLLRFLRTPWSSSKCFYFWENVGNLQNIWKVFCTTENFSNRLETFNNKKKPERWLFMKKKHPNASQDFDQRLWLSLSWRQIQERFINALIFCIILFNFASSKSLSSIRMLFDWFFLLK